MQQLFDNLMALIVENDYTKFFYKDFTTILGTPVRIFTYNYASYSDWLNPDALEARGVMFELDENKQPVRIMSRPMEKFFNLDENPFTLRIDMLDKISYAMDKADGSLISTYIDNGILYTKSKASIHSNQAIEARMELLSIDNAALHDRVQQLAIDGYTCNFELVAPNNRIVIAYPERALILLNVRHNDTGDYVPYSDLYADPVLRPYLVKIFDTTETSGSELIDQIRAMQNIEGCVFVCEDGQKFKVKTEWYSHLHRVKNTLTNNIALFETVVGGASDDLKSLFDDELSKSKITEFESIFFRYLSEAVSSIEKFYADYRGSDRKTYAINGQAHFKKLGRFELFNVVMQMFQSRLDAKTLVEEINKVFIKNAARYVPEKYNVAQIVDND